MTTRAIEDEPSTRSGGGAGGRWHPCDAGSATCRGAGAAEWFFTWLERGAEWTGDILSIVGARSTRRRSLDDSTVACGDASADVCAKLESLEWGFVGDAGDGATTSSARTRANPTPGQRRQSSSAAVGAPKLRAEEPLAPAHPCEAHVARARKDALRVLKGRRRQSRSHEVSRRRDS